MHARNLVALDEVSELVLIGRDRGRLETRRDEIAAATDLGSTRLVIGEGWEEELPTLDGAVVATTSATHPAMALDAAKAGVTALVEKPLALKVTELEALADELEGTGAETMVAFHRRYDPAHQELRRLVAAGELGALRVVTATGHDHYPLPAHYIPVSGGIWHDMLVHDFDTIPWVTGERVVAVQASGTVLDEPAHAEYDDVDTALAVLELESGAIATVTGMRHNGAGQDVRLELFGTTASYAAGLDDRNPMVSAEPGQPGVPHPYDDYADRFAPAFRAEMRAFIDLVAGRGENLTPPRAGIQAIQIADAAAESLRTGERIHLS
jgi:myo-inositol 2-dehydrogenase/D-chiro-inositol 1-dehydrogenase